MFERKNGYKKPTYRKIRNIKVTLQTNTEYKPYRIWLSIKLVKIANLQVNYLLKMG